MSTNTVAVIVDSRTALATPLVPNLVLTLEDLGHRVGLVDPDVSHPSLTPLCVDADLYVLKSGSEAALSLAGALSHRGATVVNPYAVAAACRDKIVQTAVLSAAGLPVPRSWLTTDPAGLAAETASGPLIVKDPRGSRGRGLRIARTPADLDAIERGRPWLVMDYHAPEGDDFKLYRIGDDVLGVRRRFPARTLAEKVGVPVEVDDDLRRTVMRCGEAFGIDLYGVDVIRSRGRSWVVDMSSFPGFKGVPSAGNRIGRLLSRRLRAPASRVTIRTSGEV